jgi:hypothetical protein
MMDMTAAQTVNETLCACTNSGSVQLYTPQRVSPLAHDTIIYQGPFRGESEWRQGDKMPTQSRGHYSIHLVQQVFSLSPK